MDQRPQIKQTDVIKRSIAVNGHKTSVSLEDVFWEGLREIADHNHKRLAMLVEQIDRTRTTCNLSSAIRVFVFNHFRGEKLATSEKHLPVRAVT
jgi:predicted DNA-binding ribbon-helix-helix protein